MLPAKMFPVEHHVKGRRGLERIMLRKWWGSGEKMANQDLAPNHGDHNRSDMPDNIAEKRTIQFRSGVSWPCRYLGESIFHH